jgi:CheY-like chemotaxis protein
VDDDPTFRRLFQSVLEKRGCKVVTANGGAAAQFIFTTQGPFDCATVDYLMPDMNGIELIRWLNECDSAMGTVLVTANADKKVVEEAWSAGANRFLDKPTTADDLAMAITHAIKRTRKIRNQARLDGDLRAIASSHQTILQSSRGRETDGVRIAHYPLHQAGGDFLVICPASETETLVLAADVSGHDLNAAFLSAYFQGLVRGMLRRAAKLEEILEFFNNVLLEEWSGQNTSESAVPASIAVTALWIDSRLHNLIVAVNGNPLPMLTNNDGWSVPLSNPSCPLGWFPGPATRRASYRWQPGSSVRLWTDGLEDLADKLNADPLAVAFALQHARVQGKPRPAWAEQANDDIMAISINLADPNQRSLGLKPLLQEKVSKEDQGQIDERQERWRRSLQVAIADISEDSLFDAMLVAREAMLNALEHGCKPGQSATLQISFDPQANSLRLIVSDPGPGYEAPLHQTRPVDDGFGIHHRGLQVIQQFARQVQMKRRGAELWIDIDVNLADTN